MMNKNRRPFRWQLWLLILIMPALLFSEHTAPFSSLGHHFAQMMIVLLVYGLMFYWFAIEGD